MSYAPSSHFFPLFQMQSKEAQAATEAWQAWRVRRAAEEELKKKRREWEAAHANYENTICMGPFQPLVYVWEFERQKEIIR